MKTISLLALFAILAVPSIASAQDAPDPAPKPEPKLERVRLRAGARVTYVGDSGLDPFAEHDAMPQFSLEGDYTFWRRNQLSLSIGGAWDVGGSGATTRGQHASLQVHRLTAPIEGRWSFKPWLYSFARVAPGTAALVARVEDGSSPETLGGSKWVFATDLSAGAAVRVLPHAWITPEIGYAFTTKGELNADPGRDEADVLGRDVGSRLGSLALSGAFFRVSAAVSF